MRDRNGGPVAGEEVVPQAWCNRCCMELNTKHTRIIRDVLVLKTLGLLVAHAHEKFGPLRQK